MREASKSIRYAIDQAVVHVANRHTIFEGEMRQSLYDLLERIGKMSQDLRNIAADPSTVNVEAIIRHGKKLNRDVDRCQINLVDLIGRQHVSMHSSEMYLTFLQTILFILVIAALVQMVEIVLKKISPSLYQALGIFLPLITTNCAVLGVAITVVTKEFNFGDAPGMLNLGEATVYAAATSIGYGLAMCLFAGLREHLALNSIPKPFQGLPIALITAGIMAMAFLGFSGIV